MKFKDILELNRDCKILVRIEHKLLDEYFSVPHDSELDESDLITELMLDYQKGEYVTVNAMLQILSSIFLGYYLEDVIMNGEWKPIDRKN